MVITQTLTLYVARGFALMTLTMLGALTGLVALFDFIELLRRAATRPDVGFAWFAARDRTANCRPQVGGLSRRVAVPN
jgi:lipopolysaccharide export system permease protein